MKKSILGFIKGFIDSIKRKIKVRKATDYSDNFFLRTEKDNTNFKTQINDSNPNRDDDLKARRISRRKNQVEHEYKAAISAIVKGTWPFSPAEIEEETSAELKWHAFDKDGIKIIGCVTAKTKEAIFIFEDKQFKVRDEDIDLVVNIVAFNLIEKISILRKKSFKNISKNDLIKIYKKYLWVRDNKKAAVNEIVSCRWHFAPPKGKANSNSYKWVSKDADGIEIEGKETKSGEKYITLRFCGPSVEMNSDYESLRSTIASELQQDIWKWEIINVPQLHPQQNPQQDKKESYYAFEENSFTRNADRVKSYSTKRCVYCGATVAFGSCCEKCRELHSRHRSFFGHS